MPAISNIVKLTAGTAALAGTGYLVQQALTSKQLSFNQKIALSIGLAVIALIGLIYSCFKNRSGAKGAEEANNSNPPEPSEPTNKKRAIVSAEPTKAALRAQHQEQQRQEALETSGAMIVSATPPTSSTSTTEPQPAGSANNDPAAFANAFNSAKQNRSKLQSLTTHTSNPQVSEITASDLITTMTS